MSRAQSNNGIDNVLFSGFFLKEYQRVGLYSKIPMYDENNGALLGHKILYGEDCSGNVVVQILLGQLCPRDFTCSNYIQCDHELVIDNDFIIDKWGTRTCNGKTYQKIYGDRNHLQSHYACVTPPTFHPNGSCMCSNYIHNTYI